MRFNLSVKGVGIGQGKKARKVIPGSRISMCKDMSDHWWPETVRGVWSGSPPSTCFFCSSSPSPAPTPDSQRVSLVRRAVFLLAGGESRHPVPAHAGPRARAGWAAGSLAQRTWSALLCLQPLPQDSLIDDPPRPGLLTGQQPHLCGSCQVNLPALPPFILGLPPPPPPPADML